jgi:hypothetical protein
MVSGSSWLLIPAVLGLMVHPPRWIIVMARVCGYLPDENGGEAGLWGASSGKSSKLGLPSANNGRTVPRGV